MSLRKIKLYGQLAKFVGERVLEADVSSAAQAVRFLCVNFKGIEKHMADQYYKVSAGNWEIEKDELHYPTGQSDISIVPVVGGAGGNTTRIILGVALIGLAIANPFGAASIGTFGGSSITVASLVGKVGIGLVLSGVAGLLTPVQEVPKTEDDPRRSFSFSGIQNTSRAGVAVPVVYGTEVLVGSIVISAAIDTVQVEA
tara:strand:- start:1285 stop:1881 length:597 start_codon:yes stop_codon:yes gene_type:complete